MRIRKGQKQIVMELDFGEARLLSRTLALIRGDYRTVPAKLPPVVRDSWYSTSGCELASMDAEECLEWVNRLHEIKTERVERLNRWIRRLAQCRSDRKVALRLTIDAASDFMSIINDRRLLLAAQNEIGEEQMQARNFSVLESLRPEQFAALCEIDLLASLIDAMLRMLPGNCAQF